MFSNHLVVPRSEWTSAHNASNEPIMTNTASPIITAPAMPRFLRRSNASRCVGADTASFTFSRRMNGTAMSDATAMATNGAAMPNGGSSTADITGPRAKPATSDATNVPMFFPRPSGSARITTRRTAGSAIPMPRPITARPMEMVSIVVPNPMNSRPATCIPTPATISRLAWPRSASGASVTWATNETMNPIPTMKPRRDSEMP